MIKTKYRIAEIISGIAALVFGFGLFLSYNFLLEGNIWISFFKGFSISLLLWILSQIIKKFKAVKKSFPKNAIFEISLLGIFIITGVTSIVPFSHYFTVSDRKEIIKEKIIANVGNSKRMFDEYELYVDSRIGAYEYQLDSAINGQNINPKYFESLGFYSNNGPIKEQKERKLHLFRYDIRPAEYDTLKVYAYKWLDDASKKATEWKSFGLVSYRLVKVILFMENEVTNWKSRLVNYSGRSQKAQTDPFVYQSSFESVESELTKVSFPTALSIFLAIVLQLLLLCPYFIAKRDSLNKGLLISLSKKKAEINSKKPTDIIKKNR